jgi:hypothetical protein
MPAHDGLYQECLAQIKRATTGQGMRASTVTRLALLVTGIMAGQSCVLARVARILWHLELTGAGCAAYVGRRLRRTLNDPGITLERCYLPAVRQLVDWGAVRRADGRVVIVLDESSQAGHVHLLRVSLAYRGTSIPLAWASWAQNTAQAEGAYWAALDHVLAQVAQVLPPELPVVVTADRAYDVPAFLDRLTRYRWDWVVRVKARGTLCFRDHMGREQPLRALVARHLARPGQRWKARGAAFKDAGWRTVSVVGTWGHAHAAPLVVLTNTPPHWQALAWYRRRFWIEPGFRMDKTLGWQWEASQVRDLDHQRSLLVALAWASLLTLLLGCAAAVPRLAAHQARPPRTVPRPGQSPAHPRQSLFALGLEAIQRWLIRRTPIVPLVQLAQVTAPSWTDEWRYGHYWRPGPQPVRP